MEKSQKKTVRGKNIFGTKFFFLSSNFFKDEKLKKRVEQHGTESWKSIATFFPVSIITKQHFIHALPVRVVYQFALGHSVAGKS